MYFDNVGGEILDAVLARLDRTRASSSAARSAVQQHRAVKGPANYLSLLVNRARMEGLRRVRLRRPLRRGGARDGGWLRDGQLKAREDVVERHRPLPGGAAASSSRARTSASSCSPCATRGRGQSLGRAARRLAVRGNTESHSRSNLSLGAFTASRGRTNASRAKASAAVPQNRRGERAARRAGDETHLHGGIRHARRTLCAIWTHFVRSATPSAGSALSLAEPVGQSGNNAPWRSCA